MRAYAQSEFESEGFSSYRLEDGSKSLTNAEIDGIIKSVDRTGDKIARGMMGPESWNSTEDRFFQAPKAQREQNGRFFDQYTRKELIRQSLDDLASHKRTMSIIRGPKRARLNKIIKDLASTKRPGPFAISRATQGLSFQDTTTVINGVNATWRLRK